MDSFPLLTSPAITTLFYELVSDEYLEYIY